jgi:hypothetical protein
MNENVRTILPAQEAIALRIVKPFYFTNHLALLLGIVRGLAEENTNCGNASEALAVIASRMDRLKSNGFSKSLI